jgi:CheY-like chemotaxis protein
MLRCPVRAGAGETVVRTVLIVANDPVRREALVRAYRELGDHVLPAATAHEARRMADFHAVELAIIEARGFDEIDAVLAVLDVEPSPGEVRFADELSPRLGSEASSPSTPSVRHRRAG